ncbi:MAG: UvrB/UvrC motif-containing protein, partial [Clostridia bacterium]|nr:UvrB/UvrC motif-containing protein [Clostridia bacterium]
TAITETERRRKIQQEYNIEHGIIPKTIKKDVRDIIEITSRDDDESKEKHMSRGEREQLIRRLTAEMKQAATILEFEHAAYLRDRINKLKSMK